MHVVHPYPTVWNPSDSRAGVNPASRRYSVTTFDPGAKLVFTCPGTVRPRSAAFFATRPAAIITVGFEVFVHDVMAAITTEPCASFELPPLTPTVADLPR